MTRNTFIGKINIINIAGMIIDLDRGMFHNGITAGDQQNEAEESDDFANHKYYRDYFRDEDLELLPLELCDPELELDDLLPDELVEEDRELPELLLRGLYDFVLLPLELL